MYGTPKVQTTVALDARTGRTIWEHKSPSSFKGSEFGPGPNSTPSVVSNRLYAVTADAVMYCLDKRSGKVLWKHDLAGEFGAPTPYYGYSPSPLAYGNVVIVPVDRKRPKEPQSSPEGETGNRGAADTPTKQSLMAFDQMSGSVVWKKQDFPIDYASPVLINFEGQDQLVLFMRKEIIGVDPNSGELLWHIECLPSPEENIATPIWNGSDLLFFSAAYKSGARVIRLTMKGGKTVPEELWYSRKMRLLHGNAILIGDYIYGSSGDFGSTLLTCMSINTGKVEWRRRGFKRATFVYGDGKIVLLDEDGHLALATVTPEGLTVHSKCRVTEHQSWTTPTLVGTTLYVRDRKHIMAFDLG
jgi:outer membrane protein assembly factor BamB